MFNYLVSNLLWTQGSRIAIVLGVLGLASLFIYRPFFYVFLALFCFAFFFFRNPERSCPQAIADPQILVCPADGKVVDVQHGGPGEFEGFEQKVSIFLSPLDVHVNWLPCAGKVKEVVYTPGTFTMAFLPKSSLLNERNDVHLVMADGKKILVRQIAGKIARRICCWVKAGDMVVGGQKFGMIKFGSRVDILLPAEVKLAVGIGQRVYGGQSVLGRWSV